MFPIDTCSHLSHQPLNAGTFLGLIYLYVAIMESLGNIHLLRKARGGVSRNPYARVRNQENHSVTQPYRGEGGLKNFSKVPYVISERSLSSTTSFCSTLLTYLAMID